MGTSHGKLRRLALAAAIVGGVASAATLRAGDDDDLSDGEPPAARHQQIVIAPAQPIVEMVNPRNGNQDPASQRLKWLLAQKVADVVHAARLTETQRQKLLLAGQGDLERLDDRVEELKAARGALPLLVQQVAPEDRVTRAGLRRHVFGENSLFAKTLKKTLTPEQFARYEKTDRNRRAFQHRAGVHMTVLRLSTAMGLSDDQWKRLEQVLLKETHPAQIIGHPYPAAYFNIVFVQMRRIPDEKLKPLFEPWQWRTLQRKFVEYGNFGGGFENNGIFLDLAEDPADADERARQNFVKQFEIHP